MYDTHNNPSLQRNPCRIAHRDIKVENVLLKDKSPDSQVKIADFGLAYDLRGARGYNGRSAASIKACRAIVGEEYYGTLATMAPEVMTEGGCYGPQCDVYSAGCVIYTLLSGFYPFDADTADEFEEIVKARPADAPAPFEYSEWEEVSEEAKSMLQALMQHDPTKRPTAAEALDLPWIKQGPSHAKCPGVFGGKKGAKDSKGTKQAGGKQAKMAIMRKGKHTHVAKKDHVCTMSDTRVTSHSL